MQSLIEVLEPRQEPAKKKTTIRLNFKIYGCIFNLVLVNKDKNNFVGATMTLFTN